MSTPTSKSIYLNADGQLIVKEINETYKLDASQALVKVAYSGINVCDLKFFYFGMHSYVTGFEFSGTVIEAGSTSPFKPGDEVFGMTRAAHARPSSIGAHQDFAIADARTFFRVPSGLHLKDAAVTTLVLHTAVDGIFNCLRFGFPVAGISGDDATGKAILIWGGASSVGIAAIQVAKAAGFSPIFTTASTKNHATLLGLGASQCFDYKSSTVVDEIHAATKKLGTTLSTVFDTVSIGTYPPPEDVKTSSPWLSRQSCSIDTAALKLASTVPMALDTSFVMSQSYRPDGNVSSMGFPQDPEFPTRARKVMEWFVESTDKCVKFPNVKVVRGAEAGIPEIRRVCGGLVSMEKVVIEHPM
ncbi:chaperonin 10-like protein [Leptodontidium sp. 2 PMI_412]|nr:chaperonin 10-like protein [Leptodontidium sp. 2 PMI_412]